jgi:hypothetical protein
MRRAATMVALFLLISPMAFGDQALSLSASVCNTILGALLSARWGPNSNQCRYPYNGGMKSNSQAQPYQCINQTCMNNCQGSCGYCDSRICVAVTITMDSNCVNPTSPLWITYNYQGGGGNGCGGTICQP